jgi:hypothetical protein
MGQRFALHHFHYGCLGKHAFPGDHGENGGRRQPMRRLFGKWISVKSVKFVARLFSPIPVDASMSTY